NKKVTVPDGNSAITRSVPFGQLRRHAYRPARPDQARTAPSPKCLLETLGWRCGWSVASRGPCGVAHEVPAAGVFCWLACERRASREGLAAAWLERGMRTTIHK